MKNKSLLISLADRYNGFSPYPILDKINGSQWLSMQELELIQLSSLRRLLSFVAQSVPFYQAYFKEHGLTCEDFKSLDDLKKLPIIDKTCINSQLNSFVSESATKPIVWLKTTGSTGVPFKFVRTRLAQSYKIASRLRFRNWYGVGRCDRLLNVSGIPPQEHGVVQDLVHYLHYKATSKHEIYASEITDENITDVAKSIDLLSPKVIMGYPSGIASLAIKLKNSRLDIHKPLAIFTNSESLNPLQRKQIEDTFGVIPRSDYVATEGSIAHECPCGGLHVDMEECIVEIVNQDENGVGDVVLTFLHTFDFPLIRYKIGDRAKWDLTPCACGRGLKKISSLLGRSADVIKLPNGKEYSAANINMRIANYDFIGKVEQYQIIQKNKANILLKLVLLDKKDVSTPYLFKEELSKIFEGCMISLDLSGELIRGKGGKLRTVIGF